MKEQPILFSAPMVLALLAGTKTQTRRVVKFKPIRPGLNLSFSGLSAGDYCTGDPKQGTVLYSRRGDGVWEQRTKPIHCPYGTPGDRLWVRETFRKRFKQGEMETVYLHAPMGFRLTLEITDVRVQRVQDISEEDARAEGISADKYGVEFYADSVIYTNCYGDHVPGIKAHTRAADAFHDLWDSINGKTHPWESNPWVWCLSFRRAER